MPGGGSSVAAYRPNLIPGVNPYTGGFADRFYLNPSAFTIPAPGALGDLTRGLLRGPGFQLLDLSFGKEFYVGKEGGDRILAFNADVTNLFNHPNFRLTSATLSPTLGTNAAQNQLQPGDPVPAAAATGFGVLSRTFRRKQDLGAGRVKRLHSGFI